MPRITLSINTPFGEIEVSGETPEEVLDALERLDQKFIGEVNERVSELLATQAKDDLKGVVEVGRDGPIIVTKKKLSHYACIGLILYCVRDHQASSREITRRLTASGKKVTNGYRPVTARQPNCSEPSPFTQNDTPSYASQAALPGA